MLTYNTILTFGTPNLYILLGPMVEDSPYPSLIIKLSIYIDIFMYGGAYPFGCFASSRQHQVSRLWISNARYITSMKYVKGAELTPIVKALVLADTIFKRLVGRELIITSMLDGKHMANSLHYKGLAFDCRTRDLAPQHIPVLVSELRNELGPDYDVIYETDPPHIHIEYDPKVH